MKSFVEHVGHGVPIEKAEVDTDQIIPARFLKMPRGTGYDRYLFHDLRFDAGGAEKPDFVLNQDAYRKASVIVAGRNFGCGSSREGAAYALGDHGVRVILASSFGDIFYNNCVRNGLLPIRLPEADVARIQKRLVDDPQAVIRVDLAAQTVDVDGVGTLTFAIEPGVKSRLLEGLDDIGATLKFDAAIRDFERQHESDSPWLVPPAANRST